MEINRKHNSLLLSAPHHIEWFRPPYHIKWWGSWFRGPDNMGSRLELFSSSGNGISPEVSMWWTSILRPRNCVEKYVRDNFVVAVVFGKHVYLNIWCLLFAPLAGRRGSFSAKRKHRYLPTEAEKCLHFSTLLWSTVVRKSSCIEEWWGETAL